MSLGSCKCRHKDWDGIDRSMVVFHVFAGFPAVYYIPGAAGIHEGITDTRLITRYLTFIHTQYWKMDHWVFDGGDPWDASNYHVEWTKEYTITDTSVYSKYDLFPKSTIVEDGDKDAMQFALMYPVGTVGDAHFKRESPDKNKPNLIGRDHETIYASEEFALSEPWDVDEFQAQCHDLYNKLDFGRIRSLTAANPRYRESHIAFNADATIGYCDVTLNEDGVSSHFDKTNIVDGINAPSASYPGLEIIIPAEDPDHQYIYIRHSYASLHGIFNGHPEEPAQSVCNYRPTEVVGASQTLAFVGKITVMALTPTAQYSVNAYDHPDRRHYKAANFTCVEFDSGADDSIEIGSTDYDAETHIAHLVKPGPC